MNLLREWITRFDGMLPGINEFERGFYAALLMTGAVLVLLLLCCLIYRLKRRRPGLPGILLEREDGNVFVARAALSQAVLRLGNALPGVEIQKVSLRKLRSGKGLELTVTLVYNPREGAFDTTVKELKDRIFRELNETFGIDTVKAVAVILTRLPGKDRPAGDGDDGSASASVPGF